MTGTTDLEFLEPIHLSASYQRRIYGTASYVPELAKGASYDPEFALHGHGGVG